MARPNETEEQSLDEAPRGFYNNACSCDYDNETMRLLRLCTDWSLPLLLQGSARRPEGALRLSCTPRPRQQGSTPRPPTEMPPRSRP